MASAAALLEEGRAGGPQLQLQQAGALAAAGLVRRPIPLGLTQLMGVLKLAHSQELADQQQAAIELATLLDKPLPALSFAPVAHALCKLLPSANRTTVFYAARAAKLLVLDDALRGQTLSVGLPGVLARILSAWKEEVPCLRELLGAMQTLAYDKATVKAVVACSGQEAQARKVAAAQAGRGGGGDAGSSKAIPSAEERQQEQEEAGAGATALAETDALGTILALLEARDGEVKALATATVANLATYSDTIFLAHRPFLDGMRDQGLPVLLQTVQR